MQSGRKYFDVAHKIRNSDLPKLFEFFNPKKNQVQVFGNSINGDSVPKLLDALGYEVEFKDDGFWYAKIPKEYRTKKVTIEKTINW